MKFGNSNSTNMAGDPTDALNQMPLRLLESFFPGLSVISRFLVTSFGIDVTTILSTCVLAVAVVSSCRYIFRYATNFVNTWLTAKIVISSSDRLYDQVMDYVSRNILNDSSRALMAKSAGTNWDLGQQRHMARNSWFAQQTGGNSSAITTAAGEFVTNPPPLYAPSIGTHRFWHRGRFFTFKRENQTLADGNAGMLERELITITSIGRSPSAIKNLLRDCQTLALEQKRSMTTIRPSTGNGWQRALTRPSRPMETVYMNESVKTDLLDDVRDFLSPMQPRYYARRGIPYRRGYLFFGPPGTGKTSLTLALAGTLGLELHVLSLMEAGLTEQRLMTQFQNLPPRCIILIEDVDAAGLKRSNRISDESSSANDTKDVDPKDTKEKDKDGETKSAGGEDTTKQAPKMHQRRMGERTIYVSEPDKLSLSGLLNVIDGVASQEGRILIMTTNSPEALDEALVRPGRVDMQVHFGNLSKTNAKRIFLRMYADDDVAAPVDAASVPEIRIDKAANGHVEATTGKSTVEKDGVAVKSEVDEELERLATQFADAIPELRMTPAEVQGFLLTRRKSPQKALTDVRGWVEGVLAAKAEGRNIVGAGEGEEAVPQLGENGAAVRPLEA